jgi:hypothetical protein
MMLRQPEALIDPPTFGQFYADENLRQTWQTVGMRRVIQRLPNEDDPQFLIKTFAQQRASILDDGPSPTDGN